MYPAHSCHGEGTSWNPTRLLKIPGSDQYRWVIQPFRLSHPGAAPARHPGARHHHRKRPPPVARACGRGRLPFAGRTARQSAGSRVCCDACSCATAFRKPCRSSKPRSRPTACIPPKALSCRRLPRRCSSCPTSRPPATPIHPFLWIARCAMACSKTTAVPPTSYRCRLPVRPAAPKSSLHCLHPRSLGAARPRRCASCSGRRHHPSTRSTQDHRRQACEHQRATPSSHPRQSLAHGHWSTGHPQGRTPAGVCPHHQRKHLHNLWKARSTGSNAPSRPLS